MMKTRALVNCALSVFVSISAIGTASGANAKSNLNCESVAVLTSIKEVSSGHKLLITLTNPTAKPIELVQFYFGENMLRLNAVSIPRGRELRRVIPLLSPGVNNAVINPRSTLLREIDLVAVFPDLENLLEKTDVLVSWEIQINPIDACFKEKISTSMILSKKN